MWLPRTPGRPQACFKNGINMVSLFTQMNIINSIKNDIIKDKLSKFFISELCIKLVGLVLRTKN